MNYISATCVFNCNKLTSCNDEFENALRQRLGTQEKTSSDW